MSDFWVKKMKTYFVRIDFDKDGAITKNDFQGMATRFIEAGKFDDAKAKDLTNTLLAVWDKFISHLGGADHTALNQEQFLTSMKKAVHDPASKAALEGPLPLFFHAVDADLDGQISGDEYKQFFTILGLDPALAEPSFKAIDTNNDGKLSLEEFSTAGVDFFINDKETPNSVFWGPLV